MGGQAWFWPTAPAAHKKRKGARKARRAAEEQAMQIEDAARRKTMFLGKQAEVTRKSQAAGGAAQGLAPGGANDILQLETVMNSILEQEQILAGAKEEANAVRTQGARRKRAINDSIQQDQIEFGLGLLMSGGRAYARGAGRGK